jgi:site-specific DNA-methyltransferase (adenine-specific)
MELFNGDCLAIMPTIETNSVDMVLVDLPYGQTACKWDTIIDMEKMWIELKRICKSNANIVFFTTTKFGNKLINSNEKWFRYDLVWEKEKGVGFMSANKRPLRNHEMVYVFGKPSGGNKTYNPQKTEGKPYIDKRDGRIKPGKVYGGDVGCSFRC